MQIEASGRGPALVLLHGWGMHHGLFEPILGALRARYTVHAVDLPGHGLARDDVLPGDARGLAERVLDAVPDALWLGWSLGGLLTLEAALAAPARLRGAVLIGTNPCFAQRADWPWAMPAAQLDDFERALRVDPQLTLRRFIALSARGAAQPVRERAALSRLLDTAPMPRPAALAPMLDWLKHSDLRSALGAIRVPTLWLGGRFDAIVPIAAIEHAATRARGGFVAIDGAGHAPFVSDPGAVISALDAWAAERLAA